MNIPLQVFVWAYIFIFHVSISRSEIAREFEKYV